MRPLWYILNPDKTVKPVDLHGWARWIEQDDMRHVVAHTMLNNEEIFVSTIFIGFDQNTSLVGGPPILFETMVFGGKHDKMQERCRTWKEAVKQHNRILALVKETL